MESANRSFNLRKRSCLIIKSLPVDDISGCYISTLVFWKVQHNTFELVLLQFFDCHFVTSGWGKNENLTNYFELIFGNLKVISDLFSNAQQL